MDLFRSKKRDNEIASLGDLPSSTVQKKHRGLSGSLNDLLDVDKDGEDVQYTASDHTTSSDSEGDEVNKASRKQKIFAKKVIKRDKQKEKEQKKKVEKNLISMDDFLRKQSEFKMWLYEEKSKNAGDLASPKLKTHFKQFVRLWNKRKLPQKYYRASSVSDSPKTPLTPRKCNFLTDDQADSDPIMAEVGTETVPKEPPKSPFVTFGKTPPKVFKSKKLQLFGTTKDVALISIAPIGSPQVVVAAPNKENITRSEPCQYLVPKIDTTKVKPKQTSADMDTKSDTTNASATGAVPYKVSVFPWAISNTSNHDTNQNVEVCSIQTPPSRSLVEGDSEGEHWPTPPTEQELCSINHTNDSPHVPPPPPPRLESLASPNCDSNVATPLFANYADPYDKLPEKRSTNNIKIISEYQEPVDIVVTRNTRTVPDNARQVLKSLSSHSDEPDTSLYSKPISGKIGKFSKEQLEEMYSKPLKRCGKSDPVPKKELRREDLEQLYAKPLKRSKKIEPVQEHASSKDKNEFQSELYTEIMAHLTKNKTAEVKVIDKANLDPDYETIDECLEKLEDNLTPSSDRETNVKNTGNSVHKFDEIQNKEHGFAGLTKAKKKRVLAASSDKIYETYLSLGRNANPYKAKQEKKNGEGIGLNQDLKKKYKSQPDISFGEGMQVYDTVDKVDQNVLSNTDEQRPFMSSFKPVDSKYDVTDRYSHSLDTTGKLSAAHRAKSYEDGIRDIATPGTPTIMATPSFDSLCPVTPLSCRSGSSQSLPAAGRSSSSESLSIHDSYMSISTSSSLSFTPDGKSGSLQSLHSEKSLSPVPEESDEKLDEEKPETVGAEPVRKVDIINNDLFAKGLIPMTPGKISAAKHGIDLSVYLLNPMKQVENAMKSGSRNTDDLVQNELNEAKSVDINESTVLQSKSTQEIHGGGSGGKFIDAQSRLAIKDTLSGVKTKLEQSKIPARKEAERRHTVQTVHEFKTSMIPKTIAPGQVPNIGIAAKTKKTETLKKSGKSKWQPGLNRERVPEPDSKRHCGEPTQVVRVGYDQYLETDIDMVVSDKGRQPLKKSKSHSGFEHSSTSTVVTDIW